MDVATPCASSVSEGISSKPPVNTPPCDLKKSHVEPEQCTHSRIEEIVEEKSWDAAAMPSLNEEVDLKVQELGVALEVLHVQDAVGQSSGRTTSLNADEICDVKNQVCTEFGNNGESLITANRQKGFDKSATFPVSAKVLLSSLSMNGMESISRTPLNGQNSLKAEGSSYARSMSLPTSGRLVSAMKGGREQHGVTPKGKMSVKWATGVYDPPTTLMSHTVKSHQQQRPKPKKKDNKHKHNKGKASRNEKKQNHPARRNLRLQAPNSDASLLEDGFSKLGTIEAMDLAVGGQDFKCRGSFFGSSLDKVRIPFAEAT
ncbi:hypothetical protein QJS10_CPA03g01544 [Acorus calamus]|uniref:Uncharacterized protein n=1 Tax=Acorus calamus TaxID=4465 RepID=A0AAV9F7F3_ACOCL|nr:hypothetical protein QJS10_CPA03g01544 [Acorus calamus]